MNNPGKMVIEPINLQGLDEDWKIVADPQNIGRTSGWGSSIPASGVEDTPIPGMIQQIFPKYQGLAWYYHRFTSQLNSQPGFRYFVCFGAVDYR